MFHNNYKSNEKFDAHLMGHFLKKLRVVPIYLSICLYVRTMDHAHRMNHGD